MDGGTRNFAYCVLDNTTWRAPLVWKKEDLWAPKPGRRAKPSKDDVLRLTYEWCMQNKQMLLDCDRIVLENQIRDPYIVMNTVIHTCFYSRTHSVSPMTIATFFKLPRTRREKKICGVETVKRFAMFPQDYEKVDDLADAWMMAVHELIALKALYREDLVFLNQ